MCGCPVRVCQFQPTRRADVTTMVEEFIPYVSQPKKEGDTNLRSILQRIWGEDTYAVAYRPHRKGNVRYHVAFDQRLI